MHSRRLVEKTLCSELRQVGGCSNSAVLFTAVQQKVCFIFRGSKILCPTVSGARPVIRKFPREVMAVQTVFIIL